MARGPARRASTSRTMAEQPWTKSIGTSGSRASTRELVFLFQEHKSNGSPNDFFQLDKPRREHNQAT